LNKGHLYSSDYSFVTFGFVPPHLALAVGYCMSIVTMIDDTTQRLPVPTYSLQTYSLYKLIAIALLAWLAQHFAVGFNVGL